MVSFVKLSGFLSLVAAALAVDTTVYCGQWDSVTSAPYTLYINQWGKSSATSGQSCAGFTSQSGNTIAYKNTWNWSGGSGVKSYTNVNLNTNLNKQLKNIGSIPSSATWSQTGSNLVTNVAYDLFTSSSAGGSASYEFMIWLGNFNAGPISSQWGADGKPVPIATNLSIAGRTWNLYSGPNGSFTVFSFLPTSGTYTSFSGDLNLFIKYLTANRGVSTNQYLTTLQLGSEASSGSATLTVSSYSAVIN